MKTRKLFWTAAALAAAVACAKSYDADPVDSVADPVQEETDPWLYQDLLGQFQPGDGTATVSAGIDDAGTRARIDVDDVQKSAVTAWEAGDSFFMYGYSNGYYKYAKFTTLTGGTSADFTTRTSISDYPAPYYAVYPEVSKFGADDNVILLGVHLPATQTAVPGGLAEELLLAYTSTANMTDFLHFQNQVSLVRFRLTGALVPQVKKVTIKGMASLAGDAIIAVDADGNGTLTQDRAFVGDVQSNTVDLTGDFEAGQDYFIALYPGLQDGFQMIFSDAEGHSVTKTGSRLTFPRARISDFGTVDIGDAFSDSYVDPTPIQYMTADLEKTGARKPVTIAVIPEGFMAEEMSAYEMLAASGIEALMATEPFKTYRDYFNVWFLKVASQESGASITDENGNITTQRNTYFGARWGEDKYDKMTANEGTVFQYVQDHCPDIINKTHTIYEVPILMIINDSRYGGICHSYSDGRGYCMAPYTYQGGGISWNYPNSEAPSATASPATTRKVTDAERDEMGRSVGDWRNTLVHEFGGHCFSRLGDEYWYTQYYTAPSASLASHSWPVPFALNISPNYENPLWKSDLLGEDMQVSPTVLARNPLYSRIGMYQGGDVSVFNRWRSEKTSCMIDNRFYFSTWQRILIVKRIMALSDGYFDWVSFWDQDVALDPLRDQVSSPVQGREHPLPLREMPQLPPPVLHE